MAAGLEAARVLGERGHDVTLFEAAPRLGGQVLMGAQASWRGDLAGVIDWRASEIERLGADIRTNIFAEPKMFSPRTPISLSSRREDPIWTGWTALSTRRALGIF